MVVPGRQGFKKQIKMALVFSHVRPSNASTQTGVCTDPETQSPSLGFGVIFVCFQKKPNCFDSPFIQMAMP